MRSAGLDEFFDDNPDYGLRILLPLLVGAAVLLAGAGAALALGSAGAESAAPPPASIGMEMDRPLPTSLLHLKFTDQGGMSVTLANFAGRAVFLVPFLTSCQEECPLTTGALLSIKRELAAAKVQGKAAIVEVTVDPGRDVPERLAAYARLTGVSWPLLTGSPLTVAALWRFFGIYYQVVPEGFPPGIDWQTGKPYSNDVDHSDGFVLLDSHLRERFAAAGMVRGVSVPVALRRLLDAQGVHDLKHPGGGSWSMSQALDAIGWVLGRSLAS